MITKIDKKSLYYLAIILAVGLLVSAGLLYYIYFVSRPGPVIDEEAFKELQKQRIIEQQLRELGELRGEVKPLTKEEIQKQLKELDKLH